MMKRRAERHHTTIYQFVRSNTYPLEKIISMAEAASMGNMANLEKLVNGLKAPDPAVRYWAAYGCAILQDRSMPAGSFLEKLLDDPFPDVAIAAAEALFYLGETEKSLARLKKALDHKDDKVRLHALNVIRTFGKGALPILPKLKNKLNHPMNHKEEDYGLRILKDIVPKLEVKK